MYIRRKKPNRYWQRRLLDRGVISFIILCLLLYFLLESLMLMDRRLRPAIISLAEIKADLLATDAVNRAIMEKVARGIFYQDLIAIKQDEQGRIIMAQVNTMEINRLMAETTIATQTALQEISDQEMKIPLGEVLNNYLLATYGPRIPVRLIPVGRVNTVLQDSFESAGINQVRHRIYLDVLSEVRIIIPFTAVEIEVHTTIPLADTIYPGEVPESVINLNLGSLNLQRALESIP
ncbi:MAG: sporulation protein YunB [Bacillota bacterium]